MLGFELNHTMLWGLMAYLIAIHLVVFFLLKSLAKWKQQAKDKSG